MSLPPPTLPRPFPMLLLPNADPLELLPVRRNSRGVACSTGRVAEGCSASASTTTGTGEGGTVGAAARGTTVTPIGAGTGVLTLKFSPAVAGVVDDEFDVKASTASAIAPRTTADPATLSACLDERLTEARDTPGTADERRGREILIILGDRP